MTVTMNMWSITNTVRRFLMYMYYYKAYQRCLTSFTKPTLQKEK